MNTLKAHFNIYGLPLEITADHPLLFENFLEDLRYFQTKKPSSSKETVRLNLTAISSLLNGDSYPAPFVLYREFASRHPIARAATITRYGLTDIAVIHRISKRHIQAAVSTEPYALPDPAYHLCFSQPVSPWLKERGLFSIHAGCVSKDSKGILIIGLRRAGKSTLSISAVRGGFKYLSDEQPLLSMGKGHLQALAFPRRIRLNRPVAALFPELHPLLESSALERIAFPIQQIWPKSLALSCEPRVLLFPQFHRQGKMRLSRIPSTAALGRLLQDDHFIWYRNGPWNQLSQQHLTLFERLVLQTRAYEIHYGSRDILRIPSVLRRLVR